MSNTPTKLDQLLENLYNSAWVEGNEYDDTREQEGMDTEVRSSRELRRCNTAKAALSAIMSEVIGEDVTRPANGDRNSVIPDYWDVVKNSVRVEQRQRAAALGFTVNERNK